MIKGGELMARKRKSGDYEGWILRLISKPEDLLHARSDAQWQAFANQMNLSYHKRHLSHGQRNAVIGMRDQALKLLEKVGIRYDLVNQYRDAKGRFTKNVEDAKTVKQVQRFSDSGSGRRTSYNVVASEIGSLQLQAKEDKKRERLGNE